MSNDDGGAARPRSFGFLANLSKIGGISMPKPCMFVNAITKLWANNLKNYECPTMERPRSFVFLAKFLAMADLSGLRRTYS